MINAHKKLKTTITIDEDIVQFFKARSYLNLSGEINHYLRWYKDNFKSMHDKYVDGRVLDNIQPKTGAELWEEEKERGNEEG